MARTPHILKNFSLFVNGVGYAGQIDEAELPEISIKTEEHRAGGMDGMYEVDMGQEAMTAKLTFSEYLAPILAKAAQFGTRIQLRGSLVRDSAGTRIPVVVTLSGMQKKTTPGNWKSGEKTSLQVEYAIHYYKWVQNGVEVWEIDVENMIRSIAGVDQLAGIRADLAL